jgi:hypothetical protein
MLPNGLTLLIELMAFVIMLFALLIPSWIVDFRPLATPSMTVLN